MFKQNNMDKNSNKFAAITTPEEEKEFICTSNQKTETQIWLTRKNLRYTLSIFMFHSKKVDVCSFVL